jgi:Arc/MetJ family transcription regulator
MKKQYDFRAGRRGAILPTKSGKTRITIRIDDDVLQWFRLQVHKAGGGSYQALINTALRTVAESSENDLEDTVRRVVREEFRRYRVEPGANRARRRRG